MHKNSFDGFLKFKDTKTFYNKSGRTQHMKRLKSSDIKLKKLISLKKNQQKRVCIICGSSSYDLLFEKNSFKHVRCKKCDFVYVNPILKQQVQENALKVENSYTRVLKNKINMRLDNLRFKYGLQKINIKKKNKKILDYGCGFGQSLDVAKITIKFFHSDSSSGKGIMELIEWWFFSGSRLNIDFPLEAAVPSGIL